MSKYLAGYGLLLIAIATLVAISPLKPARTYMLVQIQNDAQIVLHRNMSVVRCGLEKKQYRNAHCIQNLITNKQARNQ